MRNFGPLSDYRGEYSEIPVVALGHDAETITYLSALCSNILGCIAPNRTVGVDRIEKECGLKLFTISDYVKKIHGQNYYLPIKDSGLNNTVANGEMYSFLGVSENFSNDILSFLKDLVCEYGNVFVNAYKVTNDVKMLENLVNGVKVIGPDPDLRERFTTKTGAYQFVKNLEIPTIDGYVAKDLDETCAIVDEMVSHGWNDGAFVSKNHCAGGKGCLMAWSSSDVIKKFHDDPKASFLVTRYIDDVMVSPSNNLIIGNDEMMNLLVSDQLLEGTRFIGAKYPTSLPDKTIRLIERYTRKIALGLSELGYRGDAGFDWMVRSNGDLFFCEINSRKAFSTIWNSFMMEQTKTSGVPSVPYLEVLAVKNEPLGVSRADYGDNPDIHMLSRLYMKECDSIVKYPLGNGLNYSNIFSSPVPSHSIISCPIEGTLIPIDSLVKPKGLGKIDVCRFSCVGNNDSEINYQLSQVYKELERSIFNVNLNNSVAGKEQNANPIRIP